MSRQRNNTRSDWLTLLYLLGGVFLLINVALGIRIISLLSDVTSHPTPDPRVAALQTQVVQLSNEIAPLLPTPTPTNTPAPSSTPTPTRTPRPSATPTPMSLPGSHSQTLTVIVANANVREGPGVAHKVLDTVKQGQTFKGPFSLENDWYRFCCVKGNQRGWIAGHLVQVQNPSRTTPTPTRSVASTVTPTQSSQPPFTKPPASLELDPIYTKYLHANGAHIVATTHVADRRMIQARDILFAMTATQSDLLPALTRAGLRIIIFEHRITPLHTLPEFRDWPLASLKAGGFATNSSGFTVAAPQENLHCSTILVHEIAHAIDYAVHPHTAWFAERRDSTYQNAMAAGLWQGEYAATNKFEYWAVAVERWFRPQAGEIPLTKKDPEAAALVQSLFGNAKLPPCR